MIPVFKNGDPKQMENYRGITLVVMVAIVLERVVLKRIRADREARSRETV